MGLPIYTYDNDHSINPLLYDTIYIVVDLSNSHWTGLIIDTTLRHVTYYDSLGDYSSEKNNVLYYTRRWLSDEICTQTLLSRITEDKALTLGDPGDWTHTHNPSPSPIQTNTSVDCGTFVLTTFLYRIQGRAPRYHQDHIHTLRNQIAHALLNFTLPSPHMCLTAYDLPIATINSTSHHYLSDIPMPAPLVPPPSSFPSILDEGDLDQGDDVVYLATHTTYHAPRFPQRISCLSLPHPLPNFDLCAKFPPSSSLPLPRTPSPGSLHTQPHSGRPLDG